MKRKKSFFQRFPWVVPTIIGAPCGIILSHIDPGGISSQGIVTIGLYFAAMVAGIFFQILVHESGHLIGGLLSGYSFLSFRVGRFILLRRPGGGFFLRRYVLPGTGGQCLMLPPESQDSSLLLYNLGGGLANLITVLPCFLLRLVSPFLLFNGFLLFSAIFGLFFAAANLLPMKAGGVANDGHNMMTTTRDETERRAFLTQMWMMGRLTAGQSLRDMPDAWFPPPVAGRTYKPLSGGAAYACADRSVDAEDFPRAAAQLDILLQEHSGLLPIHRMEATLSRILCGLLLGENAESLHTRRDKALDRYEKATRPYLPGRSVLDYAWALLAEGDEETARQALDTLERVVARYPYPAEVEGCRRLVARIDAAARTNKKGDMPTC